MSVLNLSGIKKERKKIGEKFRLKRHKHKLSVREVAELSTISHLTITKIEKGDAVSEVSLKKLDNFYTDYES